MKRILAAAVALASVAAAAGAGFVWYGFYDISATEQHLAPTYWLMEKAMQRSVARHAAKTAVPPLGAAAQVARGFALYREHCVQCHGAPGVAPEPFALGLTPLPAPLAQTGREWPASHIYYVVRFGIKMTGMPAWDFRMPDEDLWAVVAFVQKLPRLSPEEYRRMAAAGADGRRREAAPAAAADAERGRIALQQYACVACHRVPGIVGPDAHTGPPLAGIASRGLLGGVLPNTPENLVRWIRAPQSVAPLSAMPDLGVTERDARDMAAYLAKLK